MFDRAGETVDQGYVIKNLKGAHIVAPSGGEVVIQSPAYFFLDRRNLMNIIHNRCVRQVLMSAQG